MGNLLSKGMEWLTAKRHAHMSSSITYKRGGAQVTLDATVGGSFDEVVEAGGSVQRIDHRDYLFRSSDLVISGSLTTPQNGDRIEQVIGSRRCTFEVLAVGGNSPWRYSDEARTTIRVRVKLVGEAAV